MDAPKPPSFSAPLVASSGASVSVADVIGQGVALAWYEAVAIVQELCLQQAGAVGLGGHHIPDPAGIRLTDAGAVIAQPGPAQSDAVQRAARLLGTMLTDRSLPVRLRLFVIEATSASQTWSIGDFAKGLQSFEHEGRTQLILGVYRRCAELRAGVSPADAARPAADARAPVSPHRLTGSRRSHRWLTVAAVVCGAGLVGAAVAWVSRGASWPVLARFAPTVAAGLGSGSGTAGPDGGSALKADVAPNAAASSSRMGTTGVAASTSASTNRPSAGGTRSRSSGEEQRSATRSGAGGQSRRATGAAPSPVAGGSPDATSLRTAQNGAQSAADDRTVLMVPLVREYAGDGQEFVASEVYSAANIDVVPPVAVRQQLPSGFLDPTRRDVGTMEILVSETGAVLQVRLGQGPNRMVHTMLLSAAKTWRFRPAMLNGKPVVYKLEQRWTVTPP